MNPGEYLSPMPRKHFVQCPVVSGYVTARLQAQDWFAPTISGAPTNMMVTFENVGNTYFSVVLNECDGHATSDPRYKLAGFTGTAVALCPGGYQSLMLQGKRKFLELACTGTTTGKLRMQIESNRQWTLLGFAKDDTMSTVGYPPALWQAKEVPGPLT
jgi:hypothetical protein